MVSYISKIRNYFITGLVVVLPLAITVYIFLVVYELLEEKLRPIYKFLFGVYIPGTAIVFTFLIIVGIGVFAKIAIGERLISMVDRYVSRVPIINEIYLTAKQASSIIFLKQRSEFKRVVLVEFPRRGVFVFGLTTAEAVKEIKDAVGEEYVNVFIPTTPIPTSGYLVMVKRKELIPVDMSVEDALKLIVTGGFAGAIRDLKKTSEV